MDEITKFIVYGVCFVITFMALSKVIGGNGIYVIQETYKEDYDQCTTKLEKSNQQITELREIKQPVCRYDSNDKDSDNITSAVLAMSLILSLAGNVYILINKNDQKQEQLKLKFKRK